MSERTAFLNSCERKLEELKKEEAFIQELLRDVQKQLSKYKVEALHMSHINLVDDEGHDTDDSGDGKECDKDEVPISYLRENEKPECAELINQNVLNLELVNEKTSEESDESEEFEESEEYISE